jgi:hypothetical protein
MGKMALGYGSEFHLLRYLGRHRTELSKKVCDLFRFEDLNVEWLDFGYDHSKNIPDSEYTGIEFLNPNVSLENKWKAFWPQSGNCQNWDAIAKVGNEWLLVEAKARAGELISNCGAKSDKSRTQIEKSFKATKDYFHIKGANDWMKRYYQRSNRIAMLYFLLDNNIPAKLLSVYFINGYEKESSPESVSSEEEWNRILNKEKTHLDIKDNKRLNGLSKELFIDVFKPF